jgi:uncharacterized repeat protein (TIGR03803 family)
LPAAPASLPHHHKEISAMSSILKSRERDAIFLLVLMFTQTTFASGQIEKMIHSFTLSTSDGNQPIGALVADNAGNLYGTASLGGSSPNCHSWGCGIVFELSPRGGSGWVETIIHNFQGGPNDGALPDSLVFDKSDNLYGTSPLLVFELSPPAAPGDAWTETVLFQFPADGSLGSLATGKLVFDGVGNLYGTTYEGGEIGTNAGTVFQLKPPAVSGAGWTHRILHNFGGFQGDGTNPNRGALAFRKGVLYGTTEWGGADDAGTVFRLVQKNGVWREEILYNFKGSPDGGQPLGDLIFDDAGSLYGTTFFGGTDACIRGCGTIYKIFPPDAPGNPWLERVLYRFHSNGDGNHPWAGLIHDKAGNLYGTASGGNFGGPSGVVFRLKPPTVSGGAWTETPLYHFAGQPDDGSYPMAEPLLLNGALYGTTEVGGAGNWGAVYSLVP